MALGEKRAVRGTSLGDSPSGLGTVIWDEAIVDLDRRRMELPYTVIPAAFKRATRQVLLLLQPT